MNIKLLIFDMDGTLVDSADANYSAYATALEEVGVELTREFFDIHCFNGQHYTQFLPQLMPGESQEAIKKVHARKQEVYARNLDQLSVHPYLKSLIVQQKETLKIALSTGAARVAVDNILPIMGLENVFDLVLTGDDIQNKKPHPEIFLRTMEYFHTEPHETVIFEDSDIGLEAARLTKAWVFQVHQWANND
ncbi:beta-phosphoglucomutase [Brevinema andersonii]|uniref:Beta-phosphoglucomutase n=1 Tax=Brevinema andersonii TaxID=34097 RepID=A0A1I1E8Z1_BREAD|nr:HAD family phosphatase [Brevinema andersonii]SFB83537.1 beta-phosphoglucomutase [Brevinema andersonii]